VGIHDSAQFKDTEIYAPLSVAVGVPVGALLPIGLSSCRHDWRARARKRRAKTVLVLLGCRANGAVEPNHLAIQHLVLEDMTHERGVRFRPLEAGWKRHLWTAASSRLARLEQLDHTRQTARDVFGLRGESSLERSIRTRSIQRRLGT